MNTKAFTVSLERNPKIAIKVIPGHFTTSNAHSNNYLDVSELMYKSSLAREVAQELATPFLSSTLVDTIVCMERTEVIGAYLAEELQRHGISVINSGSEIFIAKPGSNTNGNLIFQDNMVEWISNKNIILLVASISSGQTVARAVECIGYYGGKLSGISALFSTSHDKLKQEVHALFTSADIPGYKLFSTAECDLCKANIKLDAIISSDGYTIIG